jgi:hypothetical protein
MITNLGGNAEWEWRYSTNKFNINIMPVTTFKVVGQMFLPIQAI